MELFISPLVSIYSLIQMYLLHTYLLYVKPKQHIKNRVLTLPTKVHLVKAMVFPVVMYGCKSWTKKKAEKDVNDNSICRTEKETQIYRTVF